MKLYVNMTLKQKLYHLEERFKDGLYCLQIGEPRNLANIVDCFDIWGPYACDEIRKLQARNEELEKALKDLEKVE